MGRRRQRKITPAELPEDLRFNLELWSAVVAEPWGPGGETPQSFFEKTAGSASLDLAGVLEADGDFVVVGPFEGGRSIILTDLGGKLEVVVSEDVPYFSEPRIPALRPVEPLAGRLERMVSRVLPLWWDRQFGPFLYDHFVEWARDYGNTGDSPRGPWWLGLVLGVLKLVGQNVFHRFHRCRIREGAGDGNQGTHSHDH